MMFQYLGPFHTIGLNPSHCKGPLRTAYGSLKYYDLVGDNIALQKLIILLKPDWTSWAEIDSHYIGPHRDHGQSVALNIYLTANKAVTNFWRVKEGQQPHKWPSETTANLYTQSQLIADSWFIAQDGDAYLLDVTQVHTVKTLAKGVRVFIQLAWGEGTDFKEILAKAHRLMQ